MSETQRHESDMQWERKFSSKMLNSREMEAFIHQLNNAVPRKPVSILDVPVLVNYINTNTNLSELILLMALAEGL